MTPSTHRLTCISCHHQRDDVPSTLPRKCPLCGDLMMVDSARQRLLQQAGMGQQGARV